MFDRASKRERAHTYPYQASNDATRGRIIICAINLFPKMMSFACFLHRRRFSLLEVVAANQPSSRVGPALPIPRSKAAQKHHNDGAWQIFFSKRVLRKKWLFLLIWCQQSYSIA